MFDSFVAVHDFALWVISKLVGGSVEKLTLKLKARYEEHILLLGNAL
jgi:hypothetical protein